MKQQSTLKQISEKLGLNISTISRALKDHPDISPQTRQRVKDYAALMEYEPNTFAMSLRTNRSMLLGIIVSDIMNLFYDSVIAAIEAAARLKGYSVLILQSGESVEAELRNLDILKKNRVEGIFVSITSNTKDIDAFLKTEKKGTPIVFFDRVPLLESCNKICFADKQAAELAALTLIRKNKKKILGLFGISTSISTTQRRLESFSETFKKHAPDAVLDIRFHNEIKDAYQITLDVLKTGDLPDAIFCMGDITLIGAMMAINKKGIKVPEEVGIINMSNGLIPLLYDPPITYIETNGYKLGSQAFLKMMDIFDSQTKVEEVLIVPVLVEGGSL